MSGLSLLLTSLLGRLKSRTKQTELLLTPGKYFLALASDNDGSKTCH